MVISTKFFKIAKSWVEDIHQVSKNIGKKWEIG
jgi:hypothetical protein